MITAQKELAFFETPADSPDIPVLLELLSDGKWHKGPDLASELFRRTNCAERTGAMWSGAKINSVAAAAVPRVISGPFGYRLFDRATIDEINHHINDLTSRSNSLDRRVIALRRHLHERAA